MILKVKRGMSHSTSIQLYFGTSSNLKTWVQLPGTRRLKIKGPPTSHSAKCIRLLSVNASCKETRSYETKILIVLHYTNSMPSSRCSDHTFKIFLNGAESSRVKLYGLLVKTSSCHGSANAWIHLFVYRPRLAAAHFNDISCSPYIWTVNI